MSRSRLDKVKLKVMKLDKAITRFKQDVLGIRPQASGPPEQPLSTGDPLLEFGIHLEHTLFGFFNKGIPLRVLVNTSARVLGCVIATAPRTIRQSVAEAAVTEIEAASHCRFQQSAADARMAHSAEIQCNFQAWRVTGKQELSLDLPLLSQHDMQGVIRVASQIMPQVQCIKVFHADALDSRYRKDGTEWRAG